MTCPDCGGYVTVKPDERKMGFWMCHRCNLYWRVLGGNVVGYQYGIGPFGWRQVPEGSLPVFREQEAV